ncbi:uncharacterized protein LOC116433720 isoform X2 [Nomia melanderi]|nr:uncharacterized protein LOC116433720 isoform X2 [Nomia melanderi]XP_031848010.1 uncharacterized protein LOC116433720 isoform X2 [Nomia melanderi]XP_031848015.1 uncharacterized protein LOC116433720 isoform X2 [Nomia melanderi]XP_031848019.1 uncharacterized protein LOC116433720 isoform X2 [Nomia melanderi]XP_031848021.1 uncharacterized protein LOC116433720 isoform X2 [Nomia melanderi]
MAANALEAKINKIRQQNEEIRRRHQEVEEDKKNAAKLNALVQMVPSSDWPERKEPPEFSNPPKAKQKSAKEKHEYTLQSHATGNEGKKIHSFAQGEGPPPDPKYNFLADSEREEPSTEYAKESSGNRFHNKVIRGSFKKKFGGRENHIQKDNKVHKGNYRDESQPGYDAWRAERNRIDEDRISRQRTAEGNWRREWDNDKMHIIDDVTKKTRSTLGDFTKKDHKDSDRRYSNNNEYVTHSKGGNRLYRGSSKNFYGNYDNRSHNAYDQHRNNAAIPIKTSLSPTSEERTVVATDKSIKVTVNQGNTTKRSVMSVKVNSPSIAGTGRVGPRQRTRVTYSHSDVEPSMPESESFRRQKSFEDKSKGPYFNNQKSPNVKRSHSQKKKEGDAKYPYHQRKEIMREDNDANSQQCGEDELKSQTQKTVQKSQSVKSPKPVTENMKSEDLNLNTNSSEKVETQECSNIVSTKPEQEDAIENNEALEICNSDLTNEVEMSETKDEVLDVKNADQNETSEMEVKEASSISLAESTSSNAKNPGDITKDDKELNNRCNENSQLDKFANDTTENSQLEELANDATESSQLEEFANDATETGQLEELAKNSTENTQLEKLANNATESSQPEESANNATENLQICSTSSEVSVPNDTELKVESVPDESNNALDDTVMVEEISSIDDQQSLEQVGEKVVNNDCDNIKDEIIKEERTSSIVDESVSSPKAEAHSVIHTENQVVYNDESVEKETSLPDEKIDGNVGSSEKKLNDTANRGETSPENTLIDSSTKEDKKQVEEVKDIAVEL